MVTRWWRRWMSSKLRPAARRRAPKFRPNLGTLEDRLAPASRLFALPAGGTIVELNPDTGAVVNSFAAPETVTTPEAGLAFDGSRLFFLFGGGSDKLYELN